jgi:hypothetical protein
MVKREFILPRRAGQFESNCPAIFRESCVDTYAIDGKTMKNAIDAQGRQTHIMSAIGHQSKACYTQKKSVLYL